MFAEDARQVWVFVMLDAADIRAIRDHFTPRVELRIENERDEISVLLLTEEAGRLLGNVAGLRRCPVDSGHVKYVMMLGEENIERLIAHQPYCSQSTAECPPRFVFMAREQISKRELQHLASDYIMHRLCVGDVQELAKIWNVQEIGQ